MSTVSKRGDRWRARYRDADGKQHERTFTHQRDAKSWLREVTAAQVTGTYVDPVRARVNLEGFYADWSQRQIWASGTVKAMDLAMRGCTYTDVPFGKLRRSHVEAWVKRMSVDGLAPGTIKTRFNNVHAVMRAAMLDKMIGSDPMADITLPRQRRSEHAMSIPTPETVGAILEASEPWMQTFVSLCAFGGLRLGEASAVQAGDFDFLRRKLTVRRQVQRAGAGLVEITPPKYGSERDVPMPDALLELVSLHLRDVGVHGRDEWLFVGDQGNPPHQNTMGYWWRKTLKVAGVEGVRLHDLRHFYASGLIAAGCDVVTVQRAVGHSNPTTTLNTYSHLWPTAEDRTRAAAADIIAASVARPVGGGGDAVGGSRVI